MPITRPSADEVVSRGTALYEQGIRNAIESGNIGRFVAIDIDSGAYEVGDDQYATVRHMHSRLPGAVLCVLKIGYPAAAVIGGSLRPTVKATSR